MLSPKDDSFTLIFGHISDTNLIPILINEKKYLVPKHVNLLRAFHYIAATSEEYDLKLQKHCWAGSCENCKCSFKDSQLGEAEGLACQMDLEVNLKIISLPKTMKRKIKFAAEYQI
ncbi:MAG TPA: hypothetical protein PK079_00435 [Leptospiraceae bacterium]|nr:hypothetical protein [Leptospiraceae bacterium]HMW05217.1 hypothetical protein [Leptospiraceae bacterium]HMX31318.1 hypothetical protein [Leptospiraceae bacterium]HMY32124.1 hypothetical protein [Leptospiraceae bacterium]HMZ63495.1 hypothetical protein [Leptospiraceae bacterium]